MKITSSTNMSRELVLRPDFAAKERLPFEAKANMRTVTGPLMFPN